MNGGIFLYFNRVFKAAFFVLFFFFGVFSATHSADAVYTFTQSGTSGFGDSNNLAAHNFVEYDSYLYACVENSLAGIEVWRTNDPANLQGVASSAVWTQVADNGFGDASNISCGDMEAFSGKLYVGSRKEVDPGELWVTSDGSTFSQVSSDGFGDSNNLGIVEMVEFDGLLYISTYNFTDGTELWRSNTDGTSFSEIVSSGVAASSDNEIIAFEIFNSQLYAANDVGGLLRTSNGTAWTQVNDAGFGVGDNTQITSLAVYDGQIYAGTSNVGTGGQIWTSSTANNQASFSQLAGISQVNSTEISNLFTRNNLLLIGADNSTDGARFWSYDGSSFTQQNVDGFGDTDNAGIDDVVSFNDVVVLSIDASGFAVPHKVFYIDLSPTVSNLVATPRNNGTGYIDISFDISTPDGADEVQALVQADVQLGSGFQKATLVADDSVTSATQGDPKIDNSADNQLGSSSGYILTSGGSNTVSTVWHSKRDNPNINVNGVQVRVRGFSGTNGSFAAATGFTLSNTDTTAPVTTATPAGGTYVNAQSVVLSCADLNGSGCDATYYTTDGSTPTTSSTQYTSPISVIQGLEIKYFSVDFASNQESVKTERYIIDSNAPVINLSKTVRSSNGAGPSGLVYPNDVLTYTVSYENSGASAAQNVVFVEQIPQYTSYLPGSLRLNNSVLSDRKDGDAGDFDVTRAQKITFDLGSVAAGFSGTFSFDVRISSVAFEGDVITGSRTDGSFDPWGLSAQSNEVFNTVRARGLIAGVVYNDLNNNGIQNVGEGGFGSVAVKIYDDVNRNRVVDSSDVLVYSGTTDRLGRFSARNMSAGFYVVQIDSSGVGSGYSLSTSVNPAQVVLRTSLASYSSAHFGFHKPSVVTRVIDSVIGGPRVDTDTTSDLDDPVVVVDVLDRVDDVEVPIVDDSNIDSKKDDPVVDNDDSVVAVVETDDDNFIQRIWKNEEVKQVVDYGVVPAVAIASLANLAVSVPFFSTLLPYLQYLGHLFTEPFRYFAVRKRRRWGRVYNAYTGDPLDLAIVRLFEADSKSLVESFVTDAKGRYYFLVDAAKDYYMTVTRDGFTFPAHTADIDKNGKKLYKGGDVSVLQSEDNAEKGIVAYDIPLEPEQGQVFVDDNYRKTIPVAAATYAQYKELTDQDLKNEDRLVRRAERRRKLSAIISWIGPVLGFISFVLAPSWLTFGIFALHILLFMLFRRLASKKAAKPWGQVFDSGKNESLAKAVVRLFDPKLGKLLHARVTAGDGRYGFLVGDEDYLLVPHRQGYDFPEMKRRIKPRKGLVKENIGLQKK